MRVAVKVGQRPTAMLFHDHYALHRNYYTNKPADVVVWTDWDYALAECVQFIADYTTQEGHLVWEAESENVTFNATRKINKARAAIDRKTKGSKNKSYEPADGEYWVTNPVLMRGDDWPTLVDWFEEQKRKNG
jgi:hypothetical protein